MADILKNLVGIIGSVLKIGLGATQVRLKNNAGVIEARDKDDAAFVILRALSPVEDNDVVTKYYADSLEKPLIVKRQENCSAALPVNTAIRGWVVVTTAGTGAAIGDVLYDDGSDDASDMAIVAAVEGRTLAITDALSGGTISFDTDSIYISDEDGSVWVKIGDIGSVTGPVRVVRYAIDNSASQDSTFTIPANARILDCQVEITTAYSAGGTISVGYEGALTEIQATTDNSAQDKATYSKEQDTAWDAAAKVVRTTVGGAPAAGVGVVIVKFTNPNV